MRIHFIGCNGVSMKTLARLAVSKGHLVSGSDIRLGGHDKRNIEGCDLVVFSGAIGDDNEELSFSRRYGIPTMERAQYLARVSMDYGRVIAVSGCHGKTTTTAMLGYALKSKSPTLHVGGDCGLSPIGRSEYFITEACEYRRGFLLLSPSVGVVTNVEHDHPDTYKDEREVIEAFSAFGKKCGTLIYNGDDKGCKKAFSYGVSFGFNSDNHFVGRAWGDKGKSKLDVFYKDLYMGSYELNLPGKHNAYNTLAAVATALSEGLSYGQIREGLACFKGVRGRLELVKSVDGCDVISDYAHHPTEIRALIATLRAKYKKIALIFQPHTYSRTQAMPEQFMGAFEGVDYLIITATFGAREKGGDDRFLSSLISAVRQCEYMPVDTLGREIARLYPDFDCVALVGAGDMQSRLV